MKINLTDIKYGAIVLAMFITIPLWKPIWNWRISKWEKENP